MARLSIRGKAYKIETTQVHLDEISTDSRFQVRQNDNPGARGSKLASAMKNGETKKFRDDPLLARFKAKLMILGGFGRINAWGRLAYDELQVRIIDADRYGLTEEDLKFLAAIDNCKNVSEEGLTKRELALSAYESFTSGFTPAEIAKGQRVAVNVVRARIEKGGRITKAAAGKSDNPNALNAYGHPKTAQKDVVTRLKRELDLSCKSIEELEAECRTKFKTEVCVYAGNHERNVKDLLWLFSSNEKQGLPTNMAVILYTCEDGTTCDAGLRNALKLMDFPRFSDTADRWFFTTIDQKKGFADLDGLKRFFKMARRSQETDLATAFGKGRQKESSRDRQAVA